jgi:hypothetical protein
MLKFMLDTDTVIYTIKNRPPAVRETVKEHSGYSDFYSWLMMVLP